MVDSETSKVLAANDAVLRKFGSTDNKKSQVLPGLWLCEWCDKKWFKFVAGETSLMKGGAAFPSRLMPEAITLRVGYRTENWSATMSHLLREWF